jgi:hypothetical protein
MMQVMLARIYASTETEQVRAQAAHMQNQGTRRGSWDSTVRIIHQCSIQERAWSVLWQWGRRYIHALVP